LVLPNFRELTTADLFGTDSEALVTLQAIFLEEFAAQNWPVPDQPGQTAEESASMKAQAKKIVIDQRRWVLTPEGLTVPFNPFEISCYVCSPPDVVVPWLKLRSILVSGALAP
jgi:hypothetical protein